MSSYSTTEKGKCGETFASDFLKAKGYKTVKRNWSCRWGEIDLITISPDRKLVIVEVKFLNASSFCDAVEMYTYKKNRNLVKTVKSFLAKHPKFIYSFRVDLICLTKDLGKLWVEHYPGIINETDLELF